MSATHTWSSLLGRLVDADWDFLPDRVALQRFRTEQDAAGIEVLIRRHGPMVWGVVQRILRQTQDSEDAFQATFLALVRETRAIENPGAWLHRAAYHIALKIKSRRPRDTGPVPDRPAPLEPSAESRELAALIDVEIDRLPERYRQSFVLCELCGVSRTEVAQRLGLPLGTLDSRLNWARQRLRDRLTRRGISLVVVGTVLVPPDLARAAIATATATTPQLLPLAQAGLTAMNPGNWKLILGGILTLGAVIGLAGWAVSASQSPTPTRPEPHLIPNRVPDSVPQPRPDTNALLLIEDVSNDQGVVTTRRLVRVPFTAGVPGKPEVIHTADQRFFGHIGGHRIHNQRYFVTQFGSVLDLTDGTLLHRELNGQVLTIESNRVIYLKTTVTQPEGIFAFDLTRKTVEKIADLGQAPWYGTRSPNGKRSVFGGPKLWELVVAGADQKGTSLGTDFGFQSTMPASTSHSARDLPVLWLDDQTILTLASNDRLVSVNVDDGNRTEIVHLKPEPMLAWVSKPPTLTRDPSGEVIYHIGREVYRVDVARKTAKKTDRVPLGHGFEYTKTMPWVITDILFHKTQELERSVANRHHWTDYRTTEQYLAFVEVRPAQRADGPEVVASLRTVRVWSVATQKWTTLSIPTNSLVGWMQ